MSRLQAHGGKHYEGFAGFGQAVQEVNSFAGHGGVTKAKLLTKGANTRKLLLLPMKLTSSTAAGSALCAGSATRSGHQLIGLVIPSSAVSAMIKQAVR